LIHLIVITAVLLLYVLVTRPKKITKVSVPIKGKLAIVIDDLGYNLNNLETLKKIRYPITASILPNLSYSRALARELHKRNFEIILHLPMEPREKVRLEENTIMTSMDDSTIRSIIHRDLSDIPYAVGVSNHMGSKATEDSATLKSVFNELKKRGLYFLDSFVSPKTIGAKLAMSAGLPFAKRNVFLDNERNPEYIKKQLYKLVEIAGEHGQAVGIGHDRKTTLEVLKEVMPEIETQGYKFVYVSELTR
jgi:polysaccharide deacetylase 2 family uncharacterized protein YibQ